MADIVIPHLDEYMREVFYNMEEMVIKEMLPPRILEKIYTNGKICFTKLDLVDKLLTMQLVGKRISVLVHSKNGEDTAYRVGQTLNVGNSDSDLTALTRLESAGAFAIVGSNIMYSMEYNAYLVQSNKYSLIRDFKKCTSSKFTNIHEVDKNAMQFLKTVDFYNNIFHTMYDVVAEKSIVSTLGYDMFVVLVVLRRVGHIRESELCKKLSKTFRLGVNNMGKKLKQLETLGYIAYNRKTNKDVKVFLSQKGDDYLNNAYLTFNKKFKQ
jgi:hypothetical protein